MYRIRRFGIVKTATTVAALYMVVIAIFVLLFAVFVAAAGRTVPTGAGSLSLDIGGVVGLGLVAIVLYGIGTWVFTAIACAFYNLVAGWVGGIEIQLDTVAPPPPVPTWGPTPTSTSTAPPPPPAG